MDTLISWRSSHYFQSANAPGLSSLIQWKKCQKKKEKAHGTIGKPELSFSPKTVLRRILNELHCIYSYKLEQKDTVMKYSPSIKLCPQHFCSQPNVHNCSLKVSGSSITWLHIYNILPYKAQGNKIHLSFALWKPQHWH